MTRGTMDGKATVELPSVTVVRQVKFEIYSLHVFFKIYQVYLALKYSAYEYDCH